jgi:hypothetical protein
VTKTIENGNPAVQGTPLSCLYEALILPAETFISALCPGATFDLPGSIGHLMMLFIMVRTPALPETDGTEL